MAQTGDDTGIVYLRPQTGQAIALLDDSVNQNFITIRSPPPEFYNTRLEGIPERDAAPHLPPHLTHKPNSNISQESTPGPYSIHPRVLRIGFFTDTIHTARGYYFGSLPDCQVKMPYHDDMSGQGCYFYIHYNFNSGALLIVAMSKIRIGSTVLNMNNSLLLMADTIIDCGGGAFQFTVEFPDLSQCAAAHERNYNKYVSNFNLLNVLYMATSREQDPPIGYLHRTKAVLGNGAYGEVHKAVHIHTGELCAIKVLNDKDEQDTLREAKVLSVLSHPNIIEYRNAFEFKGKVCIIMELAANDLYKHKNARKAIAYIHGQGYTHRDLKPTNILVTQWDSKTDLLSVKVADFGLAGIKSDLSSLCGTPGYLAPEIEGEILRRHRDEKRAGGRPRTAHGCFHYDNSVDIWTLGKILKELLEDVPNHIRHQGKMMAVNKQPAMQLANVMMSPSPQQRPTAPACLQHPWLVEGNSAIGKRDRSPSPSTAASMPPKRALRADEPGPASRPPPAIHVEQKDINMPAVPSQSKEPFNEGRSDDSSKAGPWSSASGIGKGVTFPSEYYGSMTAGMSHVDES